ncbi:MAG: S8 family serine peptidase [Chitinophagaceae bacterium]
MKRLCFLTACLIMVNLVAEAQYSRYIIIFKNKKETPFTLANPSLYLSEKSISRRSRQNIPVDSTDLPITPAYIESIRSVKNVRILNKSNWLNQLCISTTDPNALATINSFSFIKATTPVALRVMSSSTYDPQKDIELEEPFSRLNRTGSVSANSLNYGNTFNQVHLHNGEYLHNLGFTGEGITIAILDAGFFGYKTNPAFDSVRLQNRVLGEWDFVAGEQSVNEDNTHGMYCFSIMAANRPGTMVGTSPKAKFYLFRTEDVSSEYPVEEQNWAAAAELADSLGVDMISSSLAYSDFDVPSFSYSYTQRNGNTAIVTRAADLAAQKGIIVMNSAGNSGASTSDLKFIGCPADGDSVVAVGAVDATGAIAAFSSIGPNGAGKRKPNIVSVGVATTLAGIDGNPESGNGTSFANPNIAGLIACFWQAFPEISNMNIIDAVQRSSHKYNNPDDRFGYGIPDFKKAFAILIKKSFNGTISNEKCIVNFNWASKVDKTMRYEVERKTGTDTGYTKIAAINGTSSIFAMGSYSFRDTIRSLSPTVVRYRLKQILPGDSALVLLDSSISITSICLTNNDIIVSPNPFNNNINVVVNSSEPIQKISIGLYNMLGQRLYYFEGSKPAGLYSHAIPGAGLPAGGYIITIRDNRKMIYSKKIVK